MHDVLRILLVEDNPGDARLIREMLDEAAMPSVEIVVEPTMRRAVRRATAEETSAILLDLSLPDCHGLETFRVIHAVVPTVPVIVLTGTQDENEALTAVREGAQDYLVKGQVDGPILARALRYAIQRAASTEALRVSEAELERYRDHLEDLVAERTAELVEVNEELERATQAKSAFLANMSHELRTPLNSIIGFTGIMLQGMAGAINEEQRTQLEMVRRSGKRLLALVNDVLDLTRIESGRTVLNCIDFDAAPIVAACADSVRPLADEKGLELRIVLPELSLAMSSDQAKIQQILVNLLANAVKFTESGRVAIEARLADPETVVFSVTDTGVGIPEDRVARVFDDFVQIPKEGVDPEGTGLGLAISRRLARMMGGDITATSGVGVGSTFVLRLPRVCPYPDGAQVVAAEDGTHLDTRSEEGVSHRGTAS